MTRRRKTFRDVYNNMLCDNRFIALLGLNFENVTVAFSNTQLSRKQMVTTRLSAVCTRRSVQITVLLFCSGSAVTGLGYYDIVALATFQLGRRNLLRCSLHLYRYRVSHRDLHGAISFVSVEIIKLLCISKIFSIHFDG